MLRVWIGFFLGIASFLVLMFVGESVGEGAGFLAMAAYLFVCQFFLSRGRIAAHRTDWGIMLTLDATPLFAVLLMALVERREVVLSQGPAMLLAVLGGTYAGAYAASLAARRSAVRG